MTESKATDKEREALLPCPFCGSDPKLIQGASRRYHAECISCTGHIYAYSAEGVIAAWNRRAALSSRDEATADAVDAKRYRWLRAGNYPIAFARCVLNDTPHGIDAVIDDAIASQRTSTEGKTP